MSVNASKSGEKTQAGQPSLAAENPKALRHATGGSEAVIALQRAAGNQAMTNLLGRSGRPLDPGTREEMEARFGADFSDVEIHSDEAGANTAIASGARAVTSGRDVAFAPGFYMPGTPKGRLLLAHELAHVMQQGRRAETTRKRSEPDANRAAARAAGGQNAQVETGASGAMQADPLTGEEIQGLIAQNEVNAANATTQPELEQLFQEREALRAQLPSGDTKPTLPSAEGGTDRTAQSKAAAGQPAAASGREIPQAPKPAIRTDYPADEHAYSGMELAYTSKGDYPVEGVYAKGVYKSKHYWLAPHFRSGTENVVYYLAYNPKSQRNEYVVGPSQIQAFLAHEYLALVIASASYPLVGEPAEYQAKSGRAMARYMAGDLGGGSQAQKDAWSAAVRDPGFWMQAVLATAGAFAGPAESLAARTETGASTMAEESASLSTRANALEPNVPSAETQPPAPAAEIRSAGPAPEEPPAAAAPAAGPQAPAPAETTGAGPTPEVLKPPAAGPPVTRLPPGPEPAPEPIAVKGEPLPEGTHEVRNTPNVRTQSLSDEEMLRANMEAEGKTVPPGHDAHHIVPKKGGGTWGAIARERLRKLGITINDADNGIALPGSSTPRGTVPEPVGGPSHATIHNESYFKEVTGRLIKARSSLEARSILRQIESEIIGGTFPH